MKIEHLKPDELIPYQKNAKKHPGDQIKKIADSIIEFGFQMPILIDDQKTIIAGHGRWQASKLLNLERVPVIFTDGLDDNQIRAYRIADNKLAESGWDRGILAEEMEFLKTNNFDLELMGFEKFEIDKILPDYTVNYGNTDPNALPDGAESGGAQIKPGEVVILGEHRLICGDCRSTEIVDSLLSCVQADMIFTDPPYGVEYGSQFDFLNKGGKGRLIEKIEGDDLKPEEMFKKIWLPSFRQMHRTLKTSGAFYFTAPGKADLLFYFITAMRESGLDLKHLLVWVKNSLILGRSDYNYKHEAVLMGWKDFEYESQPIIYGWKETGHKFYGTAAEVSVWNIARPTKSKLHPTMKPVELMVRAIHNSTFGGEVVIDFFGGSGSTLIACEQTGRKCYMVETKPNYCATIRQRWEDFTGKKAEIHG